MRGRQARPPEARSVQLSNGHSARGWLCTRVSGRGVSGTAIPPGSAPVIAALLVTGKVAPSRWATSRHAYGTRSSRHAIHGPFHPWAKPQDRRHVLMDAQRADEHCRPPPARGTCQRRATDTVGSSDLASIDRLTIHPQGDTAGGRRCKPWYAARLLACRALAIDRCGASTTSVPARRSWNPRRLPSNRIRT